MPITQINNNIVKAFTDHQWILDVEAGELIIDNNFWQSLGLNYSGEAFKTKDLFDHVFESDSDCLRGLLKDTSYPNDKGSEIIRFQHHDGSWIWFEIKYKDLLEAGENRRVFLLFDISKSKIREQIFNQFESMNQIGGWHVNMSTMEISWTPTMFKVHGLKMGNTPSVEKAISFYKEGESRERISMLFERSIAQGKEFDGIFEFIDAQGNEKWVRSRGKPIMKNGACITVYGTIQDISTDIEKEQELAQSRKRFEDIFNSTYQFCGILDADGTMLDANETALAFAGITKNDVEGKKFWDTFWWQNSVRNRERLKKEIENAAQGKFVRYNVSVWNAQKKPITIDFSLKRIDNHDRSGFNLIAEGRPIQDLIDAKKSLEKMIRRTTKQNETLRNFAHIVSHNLRSRASNISLLSNIVEGTNGKPLAANVKTMLSDASSRLTDTIGHVSEVVVAQTSEESEYDKINISKAAKEALNTVSAIVSAAKAEVKLEVSPSLEVRGVSAYIDSIFLNLITNSIKYRSPSRPCKLRISAKKVGSKVKLIFEDNGKGIDLEKNGTKLFGMYKTFHGNEDAQGIGLFITKNQIESMGGNIGVESEINVGTRFNVELIAG